MTNNNSFFGTENIWKLLLELAPPVMLAQLIQAFYNIIDSYFIGNYSKDGLAALSIIFPIQLLITSLAVGTGVGVNTLMAKFYGLSQEKKAADAAGAGFLLSIITWAVFLLISCGIMDIYTKTFLSTPQAQDFAYIYGMIVCSLSLGIFLESNWSKVLQAKGDMKTPTIAQISGAVINIVLDWLLIFGIGFFPKLGIAGAAIATVTGQTLAAVITGIKAFYKLPSFSGLISYVKQIYRYGVPNIIMNALCTVYILGLNFILVSFSDDAVTVLGIYYKLQMFFLIPLMGLTTCIVPILSYNYAAGAIGRCHEILRDTVIVSAFCMGIGTLAFEIIPTQLIAIFVENEPAILEMGRTALRIIGISFMPVSISFILPTYFQATGMGGQSVALAVLRQIILLIPLAFAFSFLGLNFVWLAFPVTEIITAVAGYVLFLKFPLKTFKEAEKN